MLTMEQIQQRAPSVFAVEPYKMSEKYRFIPTSEVVQALINQGFHATQARQTTTRLEDKQNFTRHMLRFRHNDMATVKVGDNIPEIVLMNSHDGTSAYKIMMGIFRLVCSNGMVVAAGTCKEMSVRHSGSSDLAQQVIDASFKVIEDAPKVMSQVSHWQSKQLTRPQQIAYATAALELRDTTSKPDAEDLLQTRRFADDGSDVWRTFNTVQENLIKGGLYGRNENNQLRRTRAIKSVNEDTKLNRALWRLTEELSKAA